MVEFCNVWLPLMLCGKAKMSAYMAKKSKKKVCHSEEGGLYAANAGAHLAVILYRERRNTPVPGSPCCTGARLPAELASQSMANGSVVMAEEGMGVHGAWMGSGG